MILVDTGQRSNLLINDIGLCFDSYRAAGDRVLWHYLQHCLCAVCSQAIGSKGSQRPNERNKGQCIVFFDMNEWSGTVLSRTGSTKQPTPSSRARNQQDSAVPLFDNETFFLRPPRLLLGLVCVKATNWRKKHHVAPGSSGGPTSVGGLSFFLFTP